MRRPFHLARPLWIVAAHLALFVAARIALYTTWSESFADLSSADVLRSFAAGLVFDVSIVTVGLAPIAIALLLPFEFARAPRWRDACAWVAFAHFAILGLALAGDVAYFGVVRRHMGLEVAGLLDDTSLIADVIVDEYAFTATVAIVAIALAAWSWRHAMRWDEARAPRELPAWTPVALVPVIVLAIRGNVSGKPIGVVDAFRSGSVSAGYLELNGAFSMARGLLDRSPPRASFLPWNDAVASVQNELFAASERKLDAEFPLMRAAQGREPSRRNVVVVLLESWDAAVVDSVRRENGLAPLGITPRFDELAREGVLFTRCFAAGQRSTHGLLAVLAGIPTLPGMAYVGRGIEQTEFAWLGDMAASRGYATFLLQGSQERSFRVDSIAALAGFERYLGMEAIVAARRAPRMAEWGAWDHDLFAAAHDEFARAPRPFLSLVFTTSTHVPYQTPEAHAAPYAADSGEHRFWNSIHYADWAIGRFFDDARRAGLRDDTIFVLVADHGSAFAAASKAAPERHHIACLVIAPGLEPRVERGVVSQLDVVPTIAELAGWDVPHASLGRSLVDPVRDRTRGALCVRGEIAVRVEEAGWIEHDLSRKLGEGRYRDDADLAAIERRMLAQLQVIATTLRENRVFEQRAAVASAPR